MKKPQTKAGLLEQIGRWLVPGLGVKRWMLLILAGVTLLAVGTGIFLLELYRTETRNPLILERKSCFLLHPASNHKKGMRRSKFLDLS